MNKAKSGSTISLFGAFAPKEKAAPKEKNVPDLAAAAKAKAEGVRKAKE